MSLANNLIAYFVTDHLTGLRFLVDTGAEINVIPPSAPTCKHRKDSLSLQAVNNTPIATYGTQLAAYYKHWTAS